MTDHRILPVLGAAVGILTFAGFFFLGGSGSPEKQSPRARSEANAPHPFTALAPPAIAPTSALTAAAVGPAPGTPAVREVTPSVLEGLAQSVRLSEDENETAGNKKELWAKAIPLAQNLIDFSNADCAQRNWLTRFVECGSMAVDNSPEYFASARRLATMFRDDQELATGEPSK